MGRITSSTAKATKKTTAHTNPDDARNVSNQREKLVAARQAQARERQAQQQRIEDERQNGLLGVARLAADGWVFIAYSFARKQWRQWPVALGQRARIEDTIPITF